jgi:hypothetical protein
METLTGESLLVASGGEPRTRTALLLEAIGCVKREQMGIASRLFNMVRSVGGSVGIALLITLLSRNPSELPGRARQRV